jgi:regulator of sigma E protease
MILSAIAVILTFGVVIFLHEGGHFILCRILKVKVERFAFGFGPELVGFTKGGTRYSICAFPLGGFVKPAGEDPGEATGKPDEYFGKPWNQRLMIVAAGPAMNYVLAWLLFTGLVFWKGTSIPSTEPVIGNMLVDAPAAHAGLEIGDRILDVNGDPVKTWDEMADKIHKSEGVEVELKYKRGNETKEMKVTPMHNPETGQGMIGIGPEANTQPVGFGKAIVEGANLCWYWSAYTVKTLASKIYRMEKPELAGPVGIMQMIGKAAHSGLEDFFSLMAMISVAVGFFNVLPIPLLDGGHAAIYIYEGLSRKKLTPKALSVANSIGLAFLLTVLLFATYQDIARIRRPSWKPTPAQESAPSGKAGSAPTAAPHAKSK